MVRLTRPISWMAAARKDFEALPQEVRETLWDVLTVAAEGSKSDIAKPLRGLGSGLFEIALKHRGNAFRAIYAVQLHHDLWVIHVFQKKSVRGIETPKREIDLIRQRLKRLKESWR